MTTEREEQLLRDGYAAGITQPRELANFMAQVGHESGGLRRLEESFRYTHSAEQISGNVRSALWQGRDALEAARLGALAGHPAPLAELMYGGRMGNTEPGDAYRYRGRGYIQLTGKNQYADAGDALGLDLLGNPDLAARPEHASRIAMWYWQTNVPDDARENVRAAGAAINGADPPNGLADREQRFAQWAPRIATAGLREPPIQQEPVADEKPHAPPTFDQAMRTMLPPQASVIPHITGHYGEQRRERAHGGTDFNYVGGQAGINLEHPTVHSPVAGVVTMSGGVFGTVKIRDAQGHSHEILHLEGRHVERGQTVAAGDPIGTMGGRGPEGAGQYAQHVHYQLRDPDGTLLSPEAFWNRAHRPVHGESVAASFGPLKEGDRGAQVHELQQALVGLGLTDANGAPLEADSAFGPRTGEAVRAFQRAHGLNVDGVVGADTRRALDAALRSVPEASSAVEPVARATRTSSLDRLLAAARGDDPSAFRTALADFTDTPFGRRFQAASAELAVQPDPAMRSGGPEPGAAER